MMYKKMEEIKANLVNHLQFLAENDQLYYLEETDTTSDLMVRSMREGSSKKIRSLTGKSYIRGKMDNVLFVNENFEKDVLFYTDQGFKENTTLFKDYSLVAILGKFLYVTKMVPDGGFVMLDYPTGKELWLNKEIYLQPVLFNNKLYGPRLSAIINAYDVFTGEELWSYDFAEFALRHKAYNDARVVATVLGAYGGRVFFGLNNHYLVALDEATGQLNNQWRELPNGITWGRANNNYLPDTTRPVFLNDRKCLARLIHEYYWELNLETDELKFWDLSEYFKPLEVSIAGACRLTYSGEHLFFSSAFHRANPNGRTTRITKVGAFNLNTKEVDWTYTFDFPYGVHLMSEMPQLAGDYLYVLDSVKTLHVFQRT